MQCLQTLTSERGHIVSLYSNHRLFLCDFMQLQVTFTLSAHRGSRFHNHSGNLFEIGVKMTPQGSTWQVKRSKNIILSQSFYIEGRQAIVFSLENCTPSTFIRLRDNLGKGNPVFYLVRGLRGRSMTGFCLCSFVCPCHAPPLRP